LYGFGIFDRLDTSYYFSLVAYTTLGFGDIILPENWRILSGLIAANGFLIFGWSTAFQVEYLNNLRPDR
ncbi:MAG: ion channel, partial [Pseudomonadota bacterium]